MGDWSSPRRRSRSERRQWPRKKQRALLAQALHDTFTPRFYIGTEQYQPATDTVTAHLLLHSSDRSHAFDGRALTTSLFSTMVEFGLGEARNGLLSASGAEGMWYGFALALIQYLLELWLVPQDSEGRFRLQALSPERLQAVLCLYREALSVRH